MKVKETDISIIGGGLLGMMTALFLKETGQEITIFDKSRFATESSWAGGGILTPLYPWRYAKSVNELAFRSQLLYPAIISKIKQLTGYDPEYINTGMLISAKDIDITAINWMENNRVDYHQIVKSSAATFAEYEDYYLLPAICQVRNPALAKSLSLALQELSVKSHENTEVKKITPVSDEHFLLSTESGYYRSRKVVICAGAWSGKLSAELGVSLPIKPIRGQMLLFKGPPKLIPSIILNDGKYIIPRKDGHVLVGSTMEDVGFDKSTTQSAYGELKAFVREVCPELAKTDIVKHWSGLRPASPDGIPFISQHPKHAGLFVNSGHFRNGVVLAPASAELLRDLLMSNNPKILPTPYEMVNSKKLKESREFVEAETLL